MYFRSTKRKNKDGSFTEYYQLAHNVRHPKTGQTTAQVIHSFGRADDLDRDALVRLCRSIARVCDLEVHATAQKDLSTRRAGSATDVLPDGVSQHLTRPLGPLWVIEALWERLGIGKALRDVGQPCMPPHYERALFAMVANRLCAPHSKLGIWERWLQTVHLPSCESLALRHMYEAMDHLYKHAEQVEEAVFFSTANLLNLQVDLVFYDTTTCSFSIDDADRDEDGTQGFRALGHSKEGTWTPQIVVALAVTREGFPVRSWVFPGNKADVTTVETVRQGLRGWKLGRALFVGDAGMNSEANRQELARACGRYVLACRAASVKEVKEQVLSSRGRYKQVADNLHIKEVVVGDGEKRRRYILCKNPKQAKREAHHRAQVLAELEQQLSCHPNRDAGAKWAAELRSSKRYGGYLSVDKKNRLGIDSSKVNKAARNDGKWVLITNDDSLSIEDAADAYKALLVIEQCFRSLKKTQIQLAPMHHWLPHRIVAHVKICVQALLIQRVAEQTCNQSWMRLHHELAQLQATEFHTGSNRFFRCNTMPDPVRAILKSLEIPAPKQVLGLLPRT